MNVSK